MFSGPVEVLHQMRITEHNEIACLDLHVLAYNNRHLNFFVGTAVGSSVCVKGSSNMYTFDFSKISGGDP